MKKHRSLQIVFTFILVQLLMFPLGRPVCAFSSPFAYVHAVSNEELDSLRGGFKTDTGLELSFGIENVTYIDGV